jgi:hypothetical protein
MLFIEVLCGLYMVSCRKEQNLSPQRHWPTMLFSHKGFRGRTTPLPFVACARKAALLRGHMWSAHDSDVVGIEGKESMTGYYRQAYQDASIKTVRQRLFFVSVYALQWLSRGAPSHDLGAAWSTSLKVSECVALQRYLRVAPKFVHVQSRLSGCPCQGKGFFTHPSISTQ